MSPLRDRKNLTASMVQNGGGRGRVTVHEGGKLKLAPNRTTGGRGATFAERGINRGSFRRAPISGTTTREFDPVGMAKKIMGPMAVDTGGFTGKAAKARAHSQRSDYQSKLADIASGLARTGMEQRGATGRAAIEQEASAGRLATQQRGKAKRTVMEQRGALARTREQQVAATDRSSADIAYKTAKDALSRSEDIHGERVRALESERDFGQRERSLSEKIRQYESTSKDKAIASLMEEGGSVDDAYAAYDRMQLLGKMTPEQREAYLASEEEETAPEVRKSWWQ